MMEICNGKYCVYVHTNKLNGKMYVGQTCQEPEKRWANGSTYRGSVYFYKAIQKYGWDNFNHEIIASNLTRDEANHFEELLIQKLDTMNPENGYNLKSGGQNNLMAESVKQKISNAAKLRIGDKNPFFGKHHSDETKNKIRQANQGHTGLSGEKHPNYGKHPSKETIEKRKSTMAKEDVQRKLSENNSGANNPKAKRFNQYTRSKEFVKTWDCARYAENELGVRTQNIIRCAKGIRPTAGGFVWYYADDLAQPDKTKIITRQND